MTPSGTTNGTQQREAAPEAPPAAPATHVKMEDAFHYAFLVEREQRADAVVRLAELQLVQARRELQEVRAKEWPAFWATLNAEYGMVPGDGVNTETGEIVRGAAAAAAVMRGR